MTLERLAFSGVALIGDTLFLANDESAEIDRFTRDGDDWRLAETSTIAQYVSLPGGSAEEIDLESLAIADGWLWLVGSHALVRDAPQDDDQPKRALRRVGDIARNPNRYLLARVPLVEDAPGLFRPVESDGDREAGRLEAGKRSSILIKWLSEDPLLSRYLTLPTKEGGLDIEGIAVADDHVWLGLRGPVIRSYGVVVQLDLRGAKRGGLKAKKLEGGRRFRKYLLDLGGLGIRDLAFFGDDLFVLAGNMTAGPSPARIYRWPGAATAGDSALLRGNAVEPVLDLPFNGTLDQPEGLEMLASDRAMVFYERPSADHADPAAGSCRADVFTF